MKALYWTYGLSWGLALLGYALGVRPGSPAILALGVLYMWAPGLVALLFARREGVRLPLAFRPNRYWLFAWLFPVPLTLLSVLLSLPFGAYRGLAWAFPEGSTAPPRTPAPRSCPPPGARRRGHGEPLGRLGGRAHVAGVPLGKV
jgi:hypothetical protein